jgi:hypothetical protein
VTDEEKAEIAALLAKLTEVLHGTAHSTVHRTANALAIFLGEMDDAIARARAWLDQENP